MARKIKNVFSDIVTDVASARTFVGNFIRTTAGVTTSNFNAQGFTSFGNVRSLAFNEDNTVRDDGVQALTRMNVVGIHVLAEAAATGNQNAIDSLTVISDCIADFPSSVAETIKQNQFNNVAAKVNSMTPEQREQLLAMLNGTTQH